jgi:DHA2 family methylenomycin A resistance protein-like MFS transporter
VSVERATPSPLLPRVYRDPGFLGAVAQGALFNFAFYGLLFALSLMLQQWRDLSALASGLLFLPLTGVISIASAPHHSPDGSTGRAVLAAAEAGLTGSLVSSPGRAPPRRSGRSF